MQRTLLSLLLVAACAYNVHAQAGAALATNGFKLFGALVKCAGADKAAANPALKVTVFAPTDAAIGAFLKASGLAPADVLKNEALCDALVASHVVPAVVMAKDVKATATRAPTLLRGTVVSAATAGGKVIITDAQGNKAAVTKADIKAGSSVIHGVDRVLLGRTVFVSPAAALKFYDRRFSTLAAAVKKAGLLSTLTAPGFSGTVLAPSNRAFSKVPAAAGMSAAQLKDVLSYHVLPKARTVPQGFTSGKSYVTLLKGQSVKYTLATRQAAIAKGGMMRTLGTATFTSTSGNTATVVGPNVFAGKAVFHAINAVLIPGKGVAAGRRHLLQRGGGGESADAMSMALQSNYDQQQEDIAYAATSGSPGATDEAVQQATLGNQLVAIPSVDDAEW